MNSEAPEEDGTTYDSGHPSLAGASAMCAGVMIGAGIFALTGQMAKLAGPPFPLAFLAAAVVSGFNGCSYTRLAQGYPSAGGMGMFLMKACGFSVMTGGCAL
jgi:amino acid transporter